MDSSSLDAIKAQLTKEKTQLADNADKLRSQLAGIDENLARVDAALSALTSNSPLASLSKTQKAKERKKQALPSPKKNDVIQAMQELLRQKGVIEVEQLKELIEAKLVATGFTRSGLAMRFKEALQEELFIDTPGGVRLKDAKKDTAST